MRLLVVRLTDGFRAWLPAVRSSGVLRTGLVAADFTATVVNPGDTSSLTLAVSESSQKPGAYYFDISPANLTTLGGVTGEYLVVVEIDTKAVGGSGSPNVQDVLFATMAVFANDFDSLPRDFLDETVVC